MTSPGPFSEKVGDIRDQYGNKIGSVHTKSSIPIGGGCATAISLVCLCGVLGLLVFKGFAVAQNVFRYGVFTPDSQAVVNSECVAGSWKVASNAYQSSDNLLPQFIPNDTITFNKANGLTGTGSADGNFGHFDFGYRLHDTSMDITTYPK